MYIEICSKQEFVCSFFFKNWQEMEGGIVLYKGDVTS